MKPKKKQDKKRKIFISVMLIFRLLFGGTQAASGASLVTSVAGIPVAGWLGSFGARAFNRVGKYTLRMGSVTNGNITNATDIAELMS